MARGLSDLQKAILSIAQRNAQIYNIPAVDPETYTWRAFLQSSNWTTRPEEDEHPQRCAAFSLLPVLRHEIFSQYFGRSYNYDREGYEFIATHYPLAVRGYWANEKNVFIDPPIDAERVSVSRAIKRLESRGYLMRCLAGAHVTEKGLDWS